MSSSIDDLPAELRGVVCISDMVDFEVKNMLSNVEINDFCSSVLLAALN